MPSLYPKVKLPDLSGQADPGIQEDQVRKRSGLRSSILRVRTVTDINYLTALGSTPTGSFTVLTNQTDWTHIQETATSQFLPVLSNQVLPYPCTPVFKVRLVQVPVTYPGGQARFRVTGYDQFGNGTVEITPWIRFNNQTGTTANEANFYVCCSKVFSEVTKIEFQANGLSAGNVNEFAAGPFFWPNASLTLPGTGAVWTESVVGNNDKGSFWNMGFGLPRRCMPVVLDPTGVTALETALAAGSVLGSGNRDIVSGYIRNETQSREGAFGTPRADGARLMGGFLIGQNDPFDTWEGCRDKAMVVWVAGSVEIFDLPVSAGVVVTTVAGDIYDINLYAHSTIGKGSPEAKYPVLNRP